MIGKLSDKYLQKILETLPVEFSVLDKDDKVLAWNKHNTRIFKRPEAVVGRDVRNCHPKKSLSKVKQIIEEMKQGTRDKARFWIDMQLEDGKQHKIMIEYYALRDQQGNYMGCLEASQDITDIQSLQGQKRLLE
ncbi:MAG: PAS domain-containing protein [Candidatus Thermoplasmatota archaeon]|nr:PAS domain-containing protein [Candidatus Thermoplasmatota archaeon]